MRFFVYERRKAIMLRRRIDRSFETLGHGAHIRHEWTEQCISQHRRRLSEAARLARWVRRQAALVYDPFPNAHADTPAARRPISSDRRQERVAALRMRHLSQDFARAISAGGIL
jgi:hypothetical protein